MEEYLREKLKKDSEMRFVCFYFIMICIFICVITFAAKLY